MRFTGEKLQALREEKGWSKNKAIIELAKRTDVEVTDRAWANWEKGVNTPGSDMLPALATLFDVEMAAFFSAEGGNEDTASPQATEAA